jgi:hypothetical protein
MVVVVAAVGVSAFALALDVGGKRLFSGSDDNTIKVGNVIGDG